MPGGFKAPKAVTQEEQDILNVVKSEVEAALGKAFTKFEALLFTSQVVAGTNFLFQVQADDEVIHVKVHRPLPHTGALPSLVCIK